MADSSSSLSKQPPKQNVVPIKMTMNMKTKGTTNKFLLQQNNNNNNKRRLSSSNNLRKDSMTKKMLLKQMLVKKKPIQSPKIPNPPNPPISKPNKCQHSPRMTTKIATTINHDSLRKFVKQYKRKRPSANIITTTTITTSTTSSSTTTKNPAIGTMQTEIPSPPIQPNRPNPKNSTTKLNQIGLSSSNKKRRKCSSIFLSSSDKSSMPYIPTSNTAIVPSPNIPPPKITKTEKQNILFEPQKSRKIQETIPKSQTMNDNNPNIDTVRNKQTSKKTNNDNFVRLDLKNKSGSCRGRRNLNTKKKRKEHSRNACVEEVVDPIHDYLDGISNDVKKCPRHVDIAPVLHQVKKSNKNGNGGKMYYKCCICQSFLGFANTENNSKTFITRQIMDMVEYWKQLTIPELKQVIRTKIPNTSATTTANLNKLNKEQLLAKLKVWARDQIASSLPEETSGDNDQKEINSIESNGKESKGLKSVLNDESIILLHGESDDESYDDDDDDDDESNDKQNDSAVAIEELEFVGKEWKDEVNNISSDKSKEGDDLKKYLFRYFGYEEFRDGQEWAIRQSLSQQRSLLVAPTGFGKSLCYALPAAFFTTGKICLVVSPLLSLMQDQIHQLPPSIPAAMLKSSNNNNNSMIIQDLLEHRLKILFVSPERLATAAFQRLLKNPKFPRIALLCIDEAHCLSQVRTP